MSMVVKPKRWKSLGANWEEVAGEHKPTMPGDYLGIECEVLNPPSARGRTVYVFLDDEDVVWLLRECRERAIQLRSKTLEASQRPPEGSEFNARDHER